GRVAARLALHLGVIGPELLTGVGCKRVHPSPVASGVHDSIHDDRRGFQSAFRSELVVPRKTQACNILFVDLSERRVVCAVPVPPRREPLIRLLGGVCEPLTVNSCRVRRPSCFRVSVRGRPPTSGSPDQRGGGYRNTNHSSQWFRGRKVYAAAAH